MSKDTDALGDRMKSYEASSTHRIAFKGLPIVARLDGKCFSKFTKNLARPFDKRLTTLMTDITKQLVDEFGAQCGYTQSDEITLVWYVPSDSKSEYPFAGRLQKFESILAATASAFMTRHIGRLIPEKAESIPVFDCRAFTVPNKQEAVNCLIWRQQDCTKNAISMAATTLLGHKACMNKSGPEKQELMFTKAGVNFNDYPASFKRGVFVRRVKDIRQLSPERLAEIPVEYRPTQPVLRTFIDVEDIWLTKQIDPIGVIFDGSKVI